MGMELAHTMGAVPAGRNDGAFHSLYTNSDYLAGDLNRAFNVATRSVLAGTSDDHTVMRLVAPWNNTNTVLEKADWGLLLCRLGGPTTPDCATAGTVGSAAAGPAFVMSGTTDGSAGIPAGTIGTATGTTVVESYFSQSATTLPDSASQYRLVQKQNNAVLANQGVPIATADTHHDNTSSETHPEAGLFSIALPFNTSATRIELWKGQPGASGSLLLYARNRTDPPVVTSQTTGSPILLSLRQRDRVEDVGPLGVRVSMPARATTIGGPCRQTGHCCRLFGTRCPPQPRWRHRSRSPTPATAAIPVSVTVSARTPVETAHSAPRSRRQTQRQVQT